MDSTASANWQGDLKSGQGRISTESGALSAQPFGFNTRFEGEAGTNPEELVGAAHAGCFAMALSKELGEQDMEAENINADATVTLEKKNEGFRVTKVALDVNVEVDGDDDKFNAAVEATKQGCPISNLLNADIHYNVTRT